MPNSFKENFEDYFSNFYPILSTKEGDWTVKGFIDVFKNIYTISGDTKVVSKLIELMIFPKILQFSSEYNYDIVLSSYQNHYPDVTFIDKTTKEKIALDIKSTYRINENEVNGMTLGAFTGYFRNRDSTKNITFPYKEYSKHFILGVIYSRTDLVFAQQKMRNLGHSLNKSQIEILERYLSNTDDEIFKEFISTTRVTTTEEIRSIKAALDTCIIDERKRYKIEDLTNIISVVRDFDFFLQEKWKIAIDRPGSGNTKNIGSTRKISELKNGKALFTTYARGYDFFNDYWMNYLTKDMALAAEYDKPPYNNLTTYFAHKRISNAK